MSLSWIQGRIWGGEKGIFEARGGISPPLEIQGGEIPPLKKSGGGNPPPDLGKFASI